MPAGSAPVSAVTWDGGEVLGAAATRSCERADARKRAGEPHESAAQRTTSDNHAGPCAFVMEPAAHSSSVMRSKFSVMTS